MKPCHGSLASIIGILCLICISCSKVGPDVYSDSAWSGEYPVQTLNGTTGETEDHTGMIILQFVSGGNACIVTSGIDGLYAGNTMSLKALNCDGVAATYELSRIKRE